MSQEIRPPAGKGAAFANDEPGIALLRALRAGSRTLAELTGTLGQTPETVSAALAKWVRCGLVSAASAGDETCYQLNRDGLLRAQDLLRELLAPPALAFVARSGTGKTTYLEKLLPVLSGQGRRVGVIKHHAHPVAFDLPQKDTYRLAQAGADVVVGVSSVQVAAFFSENGAELPQTLLGRFFSGCDLVLVEGLRSAPFPKVEIHRSGRSGELLCAPDELLAEVTDEPLALDVPQFPLGDPVPLAEFLLARL
jgi:molybdopterin-guanine dinucleotide biosynthesis protein B